MHYQLTLHTVTSNLHSKKMIFEQNLKFLHTLKTNPKYNPMDPFLAMRINEDVSEQNKLLRNVNQQISDLENEGFRYGL